MNRYWKQLLGLLSRISRNESHSNEFSAQEELIVGSALLHIPSGLIWGLLYIAFGEVIPGLIPAGFSILLILFFTVFLITRNPSFFVNVYPGFAGLLPFLLQLSLGGYVQSSGVILWSFTAPLMALVLSGPRAARGWFGVFLVALASAGFLDAAVRRENNVPPNLQLLLFVVNFAAVLGISFILLYLLIAQLNLEREKSETLLLNILPEKIARVLKDRKEIIADHFAEASILFADLVGFTPMSASMEPGEIVALLNDIYSYFDILAERYGVEKIRTIGDNYMAAAGVPLPRVDHAHTLADMALDMLAYANRMPERNGSRIQFRIGMNSGPLVAGVIGKKKFQYDLWGDTVNTASRMESQGVSDRIQVTQQVYDLLRDDFRFEQRGNIEVKGRGMMQTWFLLGRKQHKE